MTPDAMAVLSALLRARPTTADELARSATIPQSRFRAAIVELVDRGFVGHLDDDGIEVPDVENPLAGLVISRIQDQIDAWHALSDVVASLPSAGTSLTASAGPATAPTERVHGTRNQWDLWMRLMGESPPQAPVAVFPDFAGLAEVVLENEAMLRETKESLDFSLRTIIRADEIADPRIRPQLAAFVELGIELRTLVAVPSWFYVDAGVLAALPITWGEAVPTSIAIVREPALLAPLRDYAERLWFRAAPLPGVATNGWDPVLALLAQGLSDGAVARALDLSVRTVRRRVADASEAYGVSSRFALAVVWSKDSED